MFNLIPSYDSNGALIERLYQWDLNQTITVKHLDFEKAPIFHFCNRKSKESLAVQSQAAGNGYTANVPNILLQQALKITAFIYYEGDGIGRTVFRTEIPVEPKPKPTDYLYDDNIADVLKKRRKQRGQGRRKSGYRGQSGNRCRAKGGKGEYFR